MAPARSLPLRIVRTLLWALGLVLLLAALALAFFRWEANEREILERHDAAPSGGRFVRGGDVEIFVQEAGPASGTVVLFMHGTGAWSETWRESMNAVVQAGFRAVALDLPPFGYSQRPEGPRYSKGEQARRILGVLDALNVKQAILVGHSFGAGPTVEATILAPERVKALVLVDAALSIREAHEPPQPQPLLERAFFAATPVRDGVVATFLTNPGFTHQLLEHFIANKASATAERIKVYQRPLVVNGTTHAIGDWLPELLDPAQPSRSEDPEAYAAISVPVVALWGARDSITPLPQGERVVKLLPHARLEVMPGVGHIPQIEGPAEFNRRLVSVLNELNR